MFGSMGDNGCLPNSCCYNVMIRGFLRNSYPSKATQLLMEMVGKGFSADIFTVTLFMDLIVHSNKSILL
ncbi:hypothetical protein Goarm_022570 [Gossypium armourianum]|uniref:Pentatricopeptide repeat-containing protein n=1 Tax=Gossypium armourianum TaxID=34283 RepID=A0A7J9KFK7_9ROSI|nr:hypothetical protein [Gossypium armourianum]